jgi:putative flippase GtrA
LKTAEVKLPYVWALPFALAILCFVGMMAAFWIGQKIFILFQAAKFFLVGTLNTFIDLGVVYFLISITNIAKGPLYSLFAAISFLVATTNSYFWNKYWTFEKRKEAPSSQEFLKFLVITAIGLGINVGVASFVVNIIGPQFGLTEKIWAGIGKLVATFFAFVWNFLGSKFIVFKQ